MNPFANPEESHTYEYEEFPKVETMVEIPSFEASGSFVDFLKLKDMPEEDPTPQVQNVILQDFKEVLPRAQEA